MAECERTVATSEDRAATAEPSRILAAAEERGTTRGPHRHSGATSTDVVYEACPKSTHPWTTMDATRSP